jgi:hypothetical protein
MHGQSLGLEDKITGRINSKYMIEMSDWSCGLVDVIRCDYSLQTLSKS